MEDIKLLKIEYFLYYRSDYGYDDVPLKESFGKIALYPNNPSKLWVLLDNGDYNDFDDWYMENLISILKDKIGNPPYKLDDFTSEKVMFALNKFHESQKPIINYYLKAKSELIDAKDIKLSEIIETSLPPKISIRGISDFRYLIFLAEKGIIKS